MMRQTEKSKGFVYVFEVSDIVLPVGKIGMTKNATIKIFNGIQGFGQIRAALN